MKLEEDILPKDQNKNLGETEISELNNSRLRILVNLKSGEIQRDSGKNILEYMKKLSEIDANRQDVQQSIASITKEILTVTFNKFSYEDILLMPVMRAGIAMWVNANEYFEFPETSFLWGVKERGTEHASIMWPKQNNADKHIIILDPIIATGDTILQAHEALSSHSTGIRSFTVIGCYASPEGVKAILDKTKDIDLIVGCMSKTVSADGYLIPPTNGDMGDKLFGAPAQ